jgi:UDP-N-acetylmuramoyl-tripeptide--D-alanyl-D-alanine ligase
VIPMTLGEVAAVTGGTLVGPPDAAQFLVDDTVTTDSRDCRPGSLYVARVGEHADGHSYAAAAVAAGAVGVLAERPVAELPCVVVADSQLAFGRLAREVVRRCPDLLVIGVTGSSGKTSTKDLLASVLGTVGPTVAPINSLNSEIGVPLTVCRVGPTTRYLVAELGARGIGHVAYLAGVAAPTIGVVLNVGVAHLGEFGSVAAIAQAKGELVDALPAHGLAVLNADDPVVAGMAVRSRARVVLVGESEHADVRASEVRLDASGRPSFLLVASGASVPVTLRLHGRHHVGNALAVAAVALEAGLTPQQVGVALSAAVAGSRWRMEVTDRPDGVTVVNDAYNANPDSMRAALLALQAMGRPADAARRRTWAVLGEMFELGPDTVAEHRGVGAFAAQHGVDRLVAVGSGAAPIADGARCGGGPVAVLEVADAEAAYRLLVEQCRAGDVVLLKSSRDAGLRFLGDRLTMKEATS